MFAQKKRLFFCVNNNARAHTQTKSYGDADSSVCGYQADRKRASRLYFVHLGLSFSFSLCFSQRVCLPPHPMSDDSAATSESGSATARKRARPAGPTDDDIAAAERALLDQLAALEYSNSSLRLQVRRFG